MSAAAAVVVPSLYEGYGLPALEGMACGVPVVAVRRSSLPEVLGQYGILVEPDANGLAEGLCLALESPDDQDLAAAKKAAKARTWTVSAEKYRRVYHEVLSA
jgi:glycosyltransferase involved in cell wall biosynthesis